MNVTQAKRIIPILLRKKVVPYLAGAHGIGKTEVTAQIVKQMGLKLVVLHMATQEVGDLIGLPQIVNGKTSHARPEWMLEEEGVVYFLDELDRAHPDVLQAMFSFIREQKIFHHQLPPNCYIIAARNYNNDQYQQTGFTDAAWGSRFCHLDFEPTLEELTSYFDTLEGGEGVADFLRRNPDMAFEKPKSRIDKAAIGPDPRSYGGMIIPLESEALGDMQFEVYEGIVGTTAASRFMTDKVKQESVIGYKNILKDYAKVRDKVLAATTEKEKRFDLISQATDELLHHLPGKTLTPRQMQNFKAYILDVPLEMVLKVVNTLTDTLWAQKAQILMDPEFVDQVKKAKGL